MRLIQFENSNKFNRVNSYNTVDKSKTVVIIRDDNSVNKIITIVLLSSWSRPHRDQGGGGGEWMTEIMIAKVVNQIRGYVDVEVLGACVQDDWAEVRALEGTPFQIIPSKAGAPMLLSDRAIVRIRELIAPHTETLPALDEDPAETDAKAAIRETAEWLDSRDYHEQTGHAPGYYGG